MNFNVNLICNIQKIIEYEFYGNYKKDTNVRI